MTEKLTRQVSFMATTALPGLPPDCGVITLSKPVFQQGLAPPRAPQGNSPDPYSETAIPFFLLQTTGQFKSHAETLRK